MGVNEEMLELAKQESTSESTQPPVSSVITDALRHLKVLEFGACAAGPCISKYLAKSGASYKKDLGPSKTEIAQLQVEGVI